MRAFSNYGGPAIRFNNNSGNTGYLNLSAGGTLNVSGAFNAGGAIFADYGGSHQVAIGTSGLGAAGLYFGSASDTVLYRVSAGVLQTQQFQIDGDLILNPAGYNYVVQSLITGTDTVNRFQMDSNGWMQWGPGGSSALDTAWGRNGANTLATYSGGFGTLQAATFQVSSDPATKEDIRLFTGHKRVVDGVLGARLYTARRPGAKGAAGRKRHLSLLSTELPSEITELGAHAGNRERSDREAELDPVLYIDLYKLATALVMTVQHLNERIATLETAASK